MFKEIVSVLYLCIVLKGIVFTYASHGCCLLLKFIWSVEEVIAAWVVIAYAYPEIIIEPDLNMNHMIHTPLRRKADQKYFYLIINLTLKLNFFGRLP
jgi:hypothetical protein